MIKRIASLIGKRRTLGVEMDLDHVELSHDQFILGLQLTWKNDTAEGVEISEVVVNLFSQGKNAQPLQLSYNGRYVRIPFQKTVTKIAGANSFYVESGASHVESLRFMTREILDLRDGTYPVELLTTISEGTYLHSFDLKITSEMKLRVSGGVDENSTPVATAASAAYTRALRLGLTSRATA